MGSDKAGLPIDGVPMAVRVARALLEAGALEVALVGRAVAGSGLAVVADAHPGEGPVGGVLTALAWAGDRRVVVAPCDLVAPSADAFRTLVAALGDDLAAMAGPADPLPLALAPRAGDPLRAAFDGGERALHRALHPLHPIDAGLPTAATSGANTPAELPPGAG